MNSFETDLEYAICSKMFLGTILIQMIILKLSENMQELPMAMIPVLASLPYGTAWLNEYESGFYKHRILRSGILPYTSSKIIICGISGGLAVVTGWYCYSRFMEKMDWDASRIFVAAALWAVFSMTFSAICKNRYITYGGGFVFYYLLIILKERYLESWYQLDPREWIVYTHQWPFGENGILVFELLAIAVMILVYVARVWRCVTDA